MLPKFYYKFFTFDSVDVDMVLAKHADSMLRERDRLLTEVNETSRRLEIQKATIEDIEKKRMDLENKNKELCKILDVSERLNLMLTMKVWSIIRVIFYRIPQVMLSKTNV